MARESGICSSGTLPELSDLKLSLSSESSIQFSFADELFGVSPQHVYKLAASGRFLRFESLGGTF